jgi:hypothetical protein
MIMNHSIRVFSAIVVVFAAVSVNSGDANQAEAKSVQSTTVATQKTTVSRASRLTTRNEDKRYATDRITAGDTPSGYVCETHNNFTSCECKGALDCFKLADSGKCNGGTWWEDDNDPSIGGCDFDDP